MVTRKEREIEFRESLIIDAAEKLFTDNGFENTKMEDIAKEADYTKPTLYKYFSCKEDIMLAVYTRGRNTSYDLILHAIGNDDTGFAKLVTIAKVYNEFFSTHPIYFSLMKYVHSKGINLLETNPEKKKIFDEERKERLGVFKMIIEKGQKDKSIVPDIESELAVEYFLNNLYINMHTFQNKEDVKADFLTKATKLMMKVFK
jgi:AcrR family transcriptional regulator